MKKIFTLLIGLSVLPVSTPVSHAQDIGDMVVPCAVPFYRELDFIVGEWQVYHRSSGELAGYDRIGRILQGCALQQSWVSLDDHFSSEYVPFRMSGRSLTAFDGSKWVHFWVDNQAGVQVLVGGPEQDRFVLRSEESVGGYDYELSWQRQDDGSLLNIHKRRTAGLLPGEWEILYEWIYRKNLNRNLYPDEDNG